MYCTNCGTQLQDKAKFCYECGEPQPGNPRAQGTDNKVANWELCDIEFILTSSGGLLSGLRGCYRAVASGTNGRFSAGQSPEVPAKCLEHGEVWPAVTDREEKRILAQLGSLLSRDGWEPLGQAGPNSWQYRYRRLAP